MTATAPTPPSGAGPTARRRGRRPAGSATRETIRDAARELFQANGYDQVSIRAVARQAGVDPALVHHYFRNKSRLYLDATLGVHLDDADEMTAQLRDVTQDDRGRAIATVFTTLCTAPKSQGAFTRMLAQGLEDPQRVRSFREFMVREVTARFNDDDLPRAVFDERAQVVVSHLLGAALARHVFLLPTYAAASPEQLVEMLAPVVQQGLEGIGVAVAPGRRRTLRAKD